MENQTELNEIESQEEILNNEPEIVAPERVPAPAGSRVYIFFNKGSGSLDSATFITCQGNV